MRGEVGPSPSTTHSDAPKGDIPKNNGNKTEKNTKKSYVYFTGISGNVYEQIHQETGKIVDYNNNPGIKYIKVIAQGSDGKEYVKYTDENGNYSFEGLKPGSYKLKFVYGTGEEYNDEEAIKTNLKYNGLDYTASSAGTVKTEKTIIEKTIIYSGTGATEIILAIDCSVSAWNTVLEDGQTRLEKQKEAAKQLINALLDEENIYIGIVCFAGDQSAWRAIGQTNNRELLMQTLDEIRKDGKCNYVALPGGTNIIGALNKSKSSFVSDESNKWIVLLSDGAPTTDGATHIYSDDTDKELIRKLNVIAKNTQNVLKKLSSNNINICSFIVDSMDKLEKEVVENIFSYKGGKGYFHSSDQEATKVIKEDILKHIIVNTKEKENITKEELVKKFDGVEDEERRKLVNKRYKEYDYQKSSNIEDLINNYTSDKLEKAKEFLNNTYMTVTVKQSYVIDSCSGEDEDYWYLSIAGRISKKTYSGVSPATYTKQNLELRPRERADVQLSIKTTGYRLRLSNGSIYRQITTDGTVDRNLKKGEIVKNIKDIRDNIYVESISDKLMYGAQVDIEYTIVLKNTSSVPISNARIINYLTDFSTGSTDGAILDYDENMRMITNGYTNAQYGWKKYSKDQLKNSVSEATLQNMKNGYYVTLDTNQSKLLRNENQIGANGERYIKIILTRKLSTSILEDNTDFEDTAEVLTYSNDLGVRMKKIFNNSNILNKLSIIPGNSMEGDVKQINDTIVKESDYAKSMRIIVIPPTGKKIDIVLSLAVLTEGTLIILFKECRKRRK